MQLYPLVIKHVLPEIHHLYLIFSVINLHLEGMFELATTSSPPPSSWQTFDHDEVVPSIKASDKIVPGDAGKSSCFMAKSSNSMVG